MFSLPTSFPTDAVSEAAGIVLSGDIASHEQTLAKDALNIIAYGAAIGLHDTVAGVAPAAKVALTDDQREQVQNLKARLEHPSMQARKLFPGDGSILKLLLPILLKVLGGFLGA